MRVIYRRAIGVPVIDVLIVNLHDHIADGKHTELFTLLPSFCLSSKFDLNATATSLQNVFGNHLSTNTTSAFPSEMKRWVKFARLKLKKHQKKAKNRKTVS